MSARRWLRGGMVVLALAWTGVASARPGGGHSFHSSSHSSSSHSSSHSYSSGSHSSSGSSLDGDDLENLFIGVIALAFMIAIFVGVIKLVGSVVHGSARDEAWSSQSPVNLVDAQPMGGGARRARLDAILDGDPKFSAPVFEDFVFQLYAALQRVRTDPAKLAALAPYAAPLASAALAARHTPVAQVVIGALRIEDATLRALALGLAAPAGPAAPRGRAQIGVRIESNLVLDDGSRTVACVEHWQFGRDVGVETQPPERTRTWPCPKCGAPWSAGDAPRTCGHCGETIAPGRFDWAVEQIWLESEDSIGLTLTGTVAEAGNDLATVRDPDIAATLAQLAADDPQATWDAMTARFTMIYAQLNTAWNASDLTSVRGLCTGSLLDYLRYWLEEYKRQGLHNVLADATIRKIVAAKLRRDHFYDALTVRVFADGHDFTTDAHGKVVGGSQTASRPYTEYWTFLRSATRRGPIVATPTCPNCGAPLAISDVGACDHCGAQVETGEFDWVLSKIEQDDVYTA